MNIHECLVEYFDNPVMTKTESTDQYSLYIAKNKTGLAKNQRIIVAMCPLDTYFVGQKIRLSELQWQAFQTRSIAEEIAGLTSFLYVAKQKPPFNALLTREKNTKEYTTYTVKEFPIRVTLFPTPEMAGEFGMHGMLNSALETYSTLIAMKN